MKPLVTVCITTFNRISLLPRAVSSVLQQTFVDFELIIVDDLSTDDTQEWVKYKMQEDPRIRYIRHEVNKGLAAARNTAIFNSRGKYFSFVDDDDQWTPQYLEEFVKVADNYDDQWCFCCGGIKYDNLGQTVYGKYENLNGLLSDYIREGYTPPNTSQFYFTSTLQRLGGYNENIKTGVDHDLWLTLSVNNIYIKSLDKYLSNPSEPYDIRRAKMTNSYHKRLSGIANSLEIWKTPIAQYYGEEFFNEFKHTYLTWERKRFFKLSLLSFDFKLAIELYCQIKRFISLKDIVKPLFLSILLRLNVTLPRTKFVVLRPAFVPPKF